MQEACFGQAIKTLRVFIVNADVIRDRVAPGPDEPLNIEPVKPEFGIDVASNLAEFDQTLASEPVSLLHWCQRKWLVRRWQIGYE